MVSKKEYDCFIGCAVILCWQYYMGRGTCKFGASCNFHHPKQGGSSGCPANLITNGIVAVTIKDHNY
ncbi:hypothetical protein GBA52_007894 [Prunus armeniaca]|nr:hypothetical protein GBA52_007894 [Prunus armeniaca]